MHVEPRPAPAGAGKSGVTAPSRHLLLLELAREGAAVEAEAAGGLGDVEITFDQHLVDAFPFERLDRGGPRDERRAGIALTLVKRVLDIVGVRRLDQIMRGAELDRLDRGGDARKIGRASCRERGCQYVWISVVAVTLKKKTTKTN